MVAVPSAVDRQGGPRLRRVHGEKSSPGGLRPSKHPSRRSMAVGGSCEGEGEELGADLVKGKEKSLPLRSAHAAMVQDGVGRTAPSPSRANLACGTTHPACSPPCPWNNDSIRREVAAQPTGRETTARPVVRKTVARRLGGEERTNRKGE